MLDSTSFSVGLIGNARNLTKNNFRNHPNASQRPTNLLSQKGNVCLLRQTFQVEMETNIFGWGPPEFDTYLHRFLPSLVVDEKRSATSHSERTSSAPRMVAQTACRRRLCVEPSQLSVGTRANAHHRTFLFFLTPKLPVLAIPSAFGFRNSIYPVIPFAFNQGVSNPLRAERKWLATH